MTYLILLVYLPKGLEIRLEKRFDSHFKYIMMRGFIMPKRIKSEKYLGVYYRVAQRIGGKGKEKVYYIVFKKDGKVFEEKVGRQYIDDMTEAKASRIRAERIEGKRLSRKEIRAARETEKQERENRWTLNRLFQLFVENKSHLKSLKDDKIRYRLHLKDILGEKEIEQISPFDVDRIRINLLKTHKPATVKQVLVLLKRIINFGIGKNLCNGLNFKVEMPRVDNIKTEDLTTDQLNRLIEAIDEDENVQAAVYMKMVLLTGMRRSELFRLKWDDIDFGRGFIHIRDPKGGSDQIIPLNKSARKLLENHPRTESEYVFPGRDGKQRTDIKRPVNRIKKRAGLPKDFRPLHGLRHVFASMLASSGQVDMYTLQKLLTHKSPLMTQRYAHLRDETLKRASNLAGELISQAVNGEKDKKVVNINDYEK